jgi:hypothetical protein
MPSDGNRGARHTDEEIPEGLRTPPGTKGKSHSLIPILIYHKILFTSFEEYEHPSVVELEFEDYEHEFDGQSARWISVCPA